MNLIWIMLLMSIIQMACLSNGYNTTSEMTTDVNRTESPTLLVVSSVDIQSGNTNPYVAPTEYSKTAGPFDATILPHLSSKWEQYLIALVITVSVVVSCGTIITVNGCRIENNRSKEDEIEDATSSSKANLGNSVGSDDNDKGDSTSVDNNKGKVICEHTPNLKSILPVMDSQEIPGPILAEEDENQNLEKVSGADSQRSDRLEDSLGRRNVELYGTPSNRNTETPVPMPILTVSPIHFINEGCSTGQSSSPSSTTSATNELPNELLY